MYNAFLCMHPTKTKGLVQLLRVIYIFWRSSQIFLNFTKSLASIKMDGTMIFESGITENLSLWKKSVKSHQSASLVCIRADNNTSSAAEKLQKLTLFFCLPYIICCQATEALQSTRRNNISDVRKTEYLQEGHTFGHCCLRFVLWRLHTF